VDRQEQIGFRGIKLGFMFGMSELPSPDELTNAHPNTSGGYNPDRLQSLRPSSLTRPHGPHNNEYQEEGWDITSFPIIRLLLGTKTLCAIPSSFGLELVGDLNLSRDEGGG
jgi:hypothetical protein